LKKENKKNKNKSDKPSKADSKPNKPNTSTQRSGRKKMKSLGTCPVCNWPVKAGIRRSKDGKKQYYHRSCFERACKVGSQPK